MMLQRMNIDGLHNGVNDDIERYIQQKIGKLDRLLPRHARESAHAEVMLKERVARNKKDCTCEVVLHLPNESLTAKETTINMFAAVDIVESKLKSQLKKYKDKHTAEPHRMQRNLSKWWRRSRKEES